MKLLKALYLLVGLSIFLSHSFQTTVTLAEGNYGSQDPIKHTNSSGLLESQMVKGKVTGLRSDGQGLLVVSWGSRARGLSIIPTAGPRH